MSVAAPQVLTREQFPKALRGFENINRYWDRQLSCISAKILPGEFYVTQHEEMITTVLGSCVSACIRDPARGIGGMNHFMLPLHKDQHWDAGDVFSMATRYGNFAMEHLINELLKYGARKNKLEAKVFGGGKIINAMTDIGESNADFVRHFLQLEKIPIAAEDLGGINPRKVLYFPKTGKVRVRKLQHLHNDTIEKREVSYLHEIEKPVAGEIDLFD